MILFCLLIWSKSGNIFVERLTLRQIVDLYSVVEWRVKEELLMIPFVHLCLLFITGCFSGLQPKKTLFPFNLLICCVKFQWKAHSHSQQMCDFFLFWCKTVASFSELRRLRRKLGVDGWLNGWMDGKRDLRKGKQMADRHLHSRGLVGFIGNSTT